MNEHMIPQFKDVVSRYSPSIIFADGEWDMPSSDWRSEELLAWLFNESPARTTSSSTTAGARNAGTGTAATSRPNTARG